MQYFLFRARYKEEVISLRWHGLPSYLYQENHWIEAETSVENKPGMSNSHLVKKWTDLEVAFQFRFHLEYLKITRVEPSKPTMILLKFVNCSKRFEECL